MPSKLDIINQAKLNIRNILLQQQNLGLDIETVLLIAENILLDIKNEYIDLLKKETVSDKDSSQN